MKFYLVVNYYLVSFSFKFHEDPCTNASARVVNAHVQVLSRVCTLTNIEIVGPSLHHISTQDPYKLIGYHLNLGVWINIY